MLTNKQKLSIVYQGSKLNSCQIKRSYQLVVTLGKCAKEKMMKSIIEDIKTNSYQRAYLLFGSEEYLKKQYKEKLLQGLNPDGDAMNVSCFEGKGIVIKQLIDLAETMPFFSDRRIIIVEDSGFFKNQCADLPEYMAELPEYLCMVFVESEVDKRSRMYKAVSKAGRVTDFSTQDDKTLMRWVLRMLSHEGKKITQKDMELLLLKTGSDMGNIEKEVEKLVCFSMGRDVITANDIEEICVTQTTNKIFDMVRAVAEKRQEKALELYYDLLALKEPPMRILFLLARQFNLLLQVKELESIGSPPNEISRKTGLQGFVVRNYSKYARQYTIAQLKKAVEDFTASEEAVKTGRLEDVLSVELLLIQYSSNCLG